MSTVHREPFDVIGGPLDGMVWYDSPTAVAVTFEEFGGFHRYELNDRKQFEYLRSSYARTTEPESNRHS